jgi:alcohol dehydrogenase YqhD (iron-dependent ADH family)
MWTATWALNTLVAMGKATDWEVHMIGQAVGAHTDATHGMTLSAVSLAYYRYILPYGLEKFKRFAINVWNVSPTGKTNEEVAKEGLSEMQKWMKDIGLVLNLKEFGVTEKDIPAIVESTLIMTTGYKVLEKDEIAQILKESL